MPDYKNLLKASNDNHTLEYITKCMITTILWTHHKIKSMIPENLIKEQSMTVEDFLDMSHVFPLTNKSSFQDIPTPPKSINRMPCPRMNTGVCAIHCWVPSSIMRALLNTVHQNRSPNSWCMTPISLLHHNIICRIFALITPKKLY